MRPASSALRQAPADSGGEGEGEGGETDTALHARAPLRRGEAAGRAEPAPAGSAPRGSGGRLSSQAARSHAGLLGRPSPGRLGGEEEDEAPHQGQVEEEGVDPAEDTLARPALGQASREPDDLQQVGQDRLVDPRGEDLAHEEGGEAGPLARELRRRSRGRPGGCRGRSSCRSRSPARRSASEAKADSRIAT